jgi:hypothetical protein
MQPIRQGDVILLPVQQAVSAAAQEELGQKLPHLILAEGEVTGHKHRVSEGEGSAVREGWHAVSASSFTDSLAHS